MSSYHFLRHTHITSQVNSLLLCQDGWRSRLRHLTCHHMNLPVLHCKQRFPIRVSRDVYIHRSPSKGLLQLNAVHQPRSTDKVLDSLCVIFVLASPTSSINVVFPLLHKETWIFHMAKMSLIYFDPLWSSFPHELPIHLRSEKTVLKFWFLVLPTRLGTAWMGDFD